MIEVTQKPYWLYLLECQGNKWYAGIALDINKRFVQHTTGKGAKFTKANPPIGILASKRFDTKSDALKAEYAVKKLPKQKKIAFFAEA